MAADPVAQRRKLESHIAPHRFRVVAATVAAMTRRQPHDEPSGSDGASEGSPARNVAVPTPRRRRSSVILESEANATGSSETFLASESRASAPQRHEDEVPQLQRGLRVTASGREGNAALASPNFISRKELSSEQGMLRMRSALDVLLRCLSLPLGGVQQNNKTALPPLCDEGSRVVFLPPERCRAAASCNLLDVLSHVYPGGVRVVGNILRKLPNEAAADDARLIDDGRVLVELCFGDKNRSFVEQQCIEGATLSTSPPEAVHVVVEGAHAVVTEWRNRRAGKWFYRSLASVATALRSTLLPSFFKASICGAFAWDGRLFTVAWPPPVCALPRHASDWTVDMLAGCSSSRLVSSALDLMSTYLSGRSGESTDLVRLHPSVNGCLAVFPSDALLTRLLTSGTRWEGGVLDSVATYEHPNRASPPYRQLRAAVQRILHTETVDSVARSFSLPQSDGEGHSFFSRLFHYHGVRMRDLLQVRQDLLLSLPESSRVRWMAAPSLPTTAATSGGSEASVEVARFLAAKMLNECVARVLKDVILSAGASDAVSTAMSPPSSSHCRRWQPDVAALATKVLRLFTSSRSFLRNVVLPRMAQQFPCTVDVAFDKEDIELSDVVGLLCSRLGLTYSAKGTAFLSSAASWPDGESSRLGKGGSSAPGTSRRTSLEILDSGTAEDNSAPLPRTTTTPMKSSDAAAAELPFPDDGSVQLGELSLRSTGSATALFPPQLLHYSNRERWLSYSVAELGSDSLALSHFGQTMSPAASGTLETTLLSPTDSSRVRLGSAALVVGLFCAARVVALELSNREGVFQHALQLQCLKGRAINPLVLHTIAQVRTVLFGCTSTVEKPLLVRHSDGDATEAMALWYRKSELRLAVTVGATATTTATPAEEASRVSPADSLWLHHVLSNHAVPCHRMEEDLQPRPRLGIADPSGSSATRAGAPRPTAPHLPPLASSSSPYRGTRHRGPQPSSEAVRATERSTRHTNGRGGSGVELPLIMLWIQCVAVLTNKDAFDRSAFSSTDAAAILSYLLSRERWKPVMEAARSDAGGLQTFLIDAVTECRDRVVFEALGERRDGSNVDARSDKSRVTEVHRDGVFLTVAELLAVEWLTPLRFVRVSLLPPLRDPSDEQFFLEPSLSHKSLLNAIDKGGDHCGSLKSAPQHTHALARQRPSAAATHTVRNGEAPPAEHVEILASLCWRVVPCASILEEEQARRAKLEHAILAEWLRVVHQGNHFRQQGHRRSFQALDASRRDKIQEMWRRQLMTTLEAHESNQRELMEQSEADEREDIMARLLLLSDAPLQTRFRRQIHRLQLAEANARSHLEALEDHELQHATDHARRALRFATSWRILVPLDGENAASRLLLQELDERCAMERSEVNEIENLYRICDVHPQAVREKESAARASLERCELDGRLPLERLWHVSFPFRELWRVYLERRRPKATLSTPVVIPRQTTSFLAC